MGLGVLEVEAGPGVFTWGHQNTGVTAAINEVANIDDEVTTIGFDTEAGGSLPTTGGIILIGTELIKYDAIAAGDMTGCVRGYLYTTPASHLDGAVITEVALEEFETLGNIEVDLSALNEKQILRTDQGGIKKIIAGIETDTIKVKIPIAEMSYNRLYQIFYSAAEEVVDDVAPTTKKYFKVQSRAGDDLTATNGKASTLRFQSAVNAGNVEKMIGFPLLCMTSLPNLTFNAEQQIYEIECEAVAVKLGTDTKGTYLTVGDITARAA